ncbi:hypothetical protein, partial [Streptomyces sp. NPDC004680]|uniref:hypothetical protein n=1 Tax=Streptomyces sp. NPDC004680 TaxID=3154287 RepID=UPI0033B25161
MPRSTAVQGAARREARGTAGSAATRCGTGALLAAGTKDGRSPAEARAARVARPGGTGGRPTVAHHLGGGLVRGAFGSEPDGRRH